MRFLVLSAALCLAFPVAAQTARPNPLRPAQPSAPNPVVTTPTPEPAKPAEQKIDGAARRTECSRRYQAAKAGNTLNGVKWPAFYSACNTELKSAG